MPKRDVIVVVCEGHYALAIFFWDGEEVFKDVAHAFAEFGAEGLEDEMRILF